MKRRALWQYLSYFIGYGAFPKGGVSGEFPFYLLATVLFKLEPVFEPAPVLICSKATAETVTEGCRVGGYEQVGLMIRVVPLTVWVNEHEAVFAFLTMPLKQGF